MKFFAVHPGAICDPGRIAPGGTVKITAKVRPSGSLSHWVELDYLHGGEGDNDDDNPRNDRSRLDNDRQGRPPPLIGQAGSPSVRAPCVVGAGN